MLSGALVGAALATAGVVFQALLRNPLATPFTLGVSAGASLGAMLVIIFGITFSAGPFSAVPLASFAGAAVATGIVYWLATPYRRAMSTAVLLLAGRHAQFVLLGAHHVRRSTWRTSRRRIARRAG